MQFCICYFKCCICWMINCSYCRISVRVSISCCFACYYTIFRLCQIRFNSQLINDISSVLQKMIQCFNAKQFQLLFLHCYLPIFCNTCFVIKRFGVFDWIIYVSDCATIWFISVIVPKNSCCFGIIFAVFKQIVLRHYKPSALSMSVLLTFEMQEINGALFLKAN